MRMRRKRIKLPTKKLIGHLSEAVISLLLLRLSTLESQMLSGELLLERCGLLVGALSFT